MLKHTVEPSTYRNCLTSHCDYGTPASLCWLTPAGLFFFLDSCLLGMQWAGSQSWLHTSSAEIGCYTV